jgi:hypothetical protein
MAYVRLGPMRRKHYYDPAVVVVRGWRVYHMSEAPVTGQWKAIRHGVEMCAGTQEALTRMIYQRED